MSDTMRDVDDHARAVFAGLVPTSNPDAVDESGRSSRGVKHTVPILLVGSMAATMLNVTGAVEPVQAKQLPGGKAAASEPGSTARILAARTTPTTVRVVAPVAQVPINYTVVAGDTVSDIAERYGLSTASVLARNGLGWSSLIFPGQLLTLTSSTPAPIEAETSSEPARDRYTIIAGETISGIAERFGVSTLSVLTANGLGWSSIIYPGQTVVIPGVVDPAAPYVEAEGEAPVAAPVETVDETPQVETDPVVTEPLDAVPVVEAAPIVEAPPAPEPLPVQGSYTIVSGDTISRIAGMFGISSQTLLDANGLEWSSVIYPGDILVIPGADVVPASGGGGSSSGSVTGLNEEMRGNAATIVAVGRELGVSDYGIVIALATAMQESSLRNLTWGDRDSVGLFQQRPSTGWGTVEELTDARHATYTFFNGRSGYTRGLLDIAGWESMPLTVAAQRVQISAYPDAYAKWEASAWAWLAELS